MRRVCIRLYHYSEREETETWCSHARRAPNFLSARRDGRRGPQLPPVSGFSASWRRARRTDPRARVARRVAEHSRLFRHLRAAFALVPGRVGFFASRASRSTTAMTTAHRPTWAPAKGHEEQGGARMFGPSKKHSKLDDNAHTILKLRCVRARVLPSHARIRPGPTRASPPPTPQPDTPAQPHAAEPTARRASRSSWSATSAPSSRSARRNISRRSSGTAPRAPRTPTPRASPRPPTTTTTDRSSCREISTPTIATTATATTATATTTKTTPPRSWRSWNG